MSRLALAALALLALTTTADARFARRRNASFDTDAVLRAAGCCKICKAGKPCGDGCISRAASCSRGFGCACSVTGGNGFSESLEGKLMSKVWGDPLAHAVLKDAMSTNTADKEPAAPPPAAAPAPAPAPAELAFPLAVLLGALAYYNN